LFFGSCCCCGGSGLGRFGFGGINGGCHYGGLGCGAWGSGERGSLLNHVVGEEFEVDAAGIFYGDVDGFEDEIGTAEVDGVADYGVDDLHERRLDGLVAFDQGYGMDARLVRGGDAAEHALMEVAKFLIAEGGRSAGDAGDFDVGTGADVWVKRHRVYTSQKKDTFKLKCLFLRSWECGSMAGYG